MAPPGSRGRPGPRGNPYGAAPARPQQGNVRNEVFENIFGRPSGAHHLGQGSGGPVAGPGGHGAPGGVPGGMGGPGPGPGPGPAQGLGLAPGMGQGRPLPYGAPAFPPAQAYNPAQPGFPPQQPQQQQPMPLQQQKTGGYPGQQPLQPQRTGGYAPQMQGPQQGYGRSEFGGQQGFEANGYGQMRRPVPAPVQGYPQQVPVDASGQPNKRASYAPSIAPSIYSNGRSDSAPGPSQQPPSSMYNGFSTPSRGNERLPPVSSLPPQVPVMSMPAPRTASQPAMGRPGMPLAQGGMQPRNVSGASTMSNMSGMSNMSSMSTISSQSTATAVSVPPPRTASITARNRDPPGQIRVTIPSPNLQATSPARGQGGIPGQNPRWSNEHVQPLVLPQPNLHRTPSSAALHESASMNTNTNAHAAAQSPDFLRAMNQVSLNSGRATPGPLDDIPGIPHEDDGGFDLSGPWEAQEAIGQSMFTRPLSQRSQSERFPRPMERPMDHRHYSTSSSGSKPQSMHSRMPSDSSIASSIYTTIGQQRVAPLSQIGNESPFQSPSTPTGSESGYGFANRKSRQSMDSAVSLPLPNTSTSDLSLPPGAGPSVFDHRATSFSGTSQNRRDIANVVQSGGSVHGHDSRALGMTYHNNSSTTSPISSQRSLLRHASGARKMANLKMYIQPALLSSVAQAFHQLVQPGELIKEGITYKDAFDGRSAVSILAEIIPTPDRSLALLLGRALDAQKFFHDVTYAHRLRDTPNEIYQFRERRLVAPFMNDNAGSDSPQSDHLSLARAGSISSATRPGDGTPMPAHHQHEPEVADDLPQGVFTLLTECYSSTCTPNMLCYSINCPRRLEQMKKLNMKSPLPGLLDKTAEDSLQDDAIETGALWMDTVPKEIYDSVDDKEKQRQERINELIYTERDFVRDLDYLSNSWMKPLLTEDVVAPNMREEFVHKVFWNVNDVLKTNHVLADQLTKRQKAQPIVQAVGDIFLSVVPSFEPFVKYGAHQLFGKYEFEKEKSENEKFRDFVAETERQPESRKLELNGYLTKPTTRLGRYPLLLEAVLKYTPDGHQDKEDIPKAVTMIKSFLAKVNEESGKAEDAFALAQLEQQLVWRPGDYVDLRLRDKNRRLIYKGEVKRRGAQSSENADLYAFLFDHAFLLTKVKGTGQTPQYKVYRRPIPLEMLVHNSPESQLDTKAKNRLQSKALVKHNSGAAAHVPPKPDGKHGYVFTIEYLGRREHHSRKGKGYSMQLWVDRHATRQKWIDEMEKQQHIIRERSTVFVTETITDHPSHTLKHIACLSTYDDGNRMIYGTMEGVYFSNLRLPKLRDPVKVINLIDVKQVDVIEEYQLLVVLHEHMVTTFPLDCLDPNDPNSALKRSHRIASHTSFFKTGVCLGRTIVAVIKSSTISSTIKVFAPGNLNARGKKAQNSLFLRRNNTDVLSTWKEFYVPFESNGVHFLKTKFCMSCYKGFEIVDLDTLDMQSLLDPSDPNLQFVLKMDTARPMAIYRIEGDFLLCYDEFAFYINKNGYRSRGKWCIYWEGSPTAFALSYPYVLAFDPKFIEVYHVESGHLVQIIQGDNIELLFADMPPSTVNAPPPPIMPPNRRLYGPPGAQQPGMARPPYPQQGYMQGYPPGMRPPAPGMPGPGHGMPVPGVPGQMGIPPAYGMQPMPAPPPVRNLAFRPQIIYSTNGVHAQFLKLPPPGQRQRRPSDSRSVR